MQSFSLEERARTMEFVLKSVAVFVIFGVCLLHVVGSQLLLDPESQAVANGSAVTLTCGLAEARFTQWFRGQTLASGRTVGNSDGDMITTTGGVSSLGRLSISSFKASVHAGEYFCLAGIKGGNAVHSCPAELTHAKTSHVFHTEPRNTSVTVGATVVLECQPPDSNPAPFINWKRDGSYLHGNDSRVVVLPTGNLYLLNVSLEDAGSYSCHAINPVTQHKRRSQLAVLTVTERPDQATSSVPTLTVYSSTTEVLEGEEVLMECAGEGVPVPMVTWRRVFGPILDPELEILPTGTLHIASARASHSGKYECLLQNSVGEASIEITLRVKAAPSVTITPHPISDSFLTLNCSFTGTEPTTVLWYKGVENLSTSQEDGGSGSVPLYLSLADPTSEGLYQCLAYSSAGCARATFNVSAAEQEDPQDPQDPVSSGDKEPPLIPTITVKVFPASVTLGPGETQELTCEASGGSGLQINWFVGAEARQGQQFALNEVVVSYLLISTPGLYQCVVLGASGFASANITVTARATPPPLLTVYPHSLEVTVGNPANFTCFADQPVSLEWVFGGQPLPAASSGTTPTDALSVVALEAVSADNHGRYVCQASGTFGLVSAAAFLRVKASPPLATPQNVQANRTVDGRVIVMWQPPAPSKLPSPLTGYKLNWDLPGRASQSALRALPHSSRFYVLEGLDIRTTYAILVWAYSSGGDGPPATITLEPLITPPPPEPVLHIASCSALSPTSAEVSWQLSTGDIFADFLDYLLSFTCEDAMATGHVTTQPGVATLQRLLSACSYRVTVTALLEGEPVAESPPCDFHTPPGEVEVDLQVERLSSSSVRLSWTLPAGMTPEEARVEVNLGDGFRPISSETHTLTDLDPSREYSLDLRLGQGAWQGSASSVIPAAPPTSSNSRELGLLYGVIIGTLVLACVVIVLFIVVLKYVQMNRRATDKVTNHREKQQEVFRRMSCSRSSSLSLKKPPLSAANGGVTHL